MQRIELDNFRVFGTPTAFDLAPVTVLTGKNNSGKSSLIKAFLVLADYLEQDDQTALRLDGPRALKHKITTFAQLANWTKDNKGKSVHLGYAKGQYEFRYEFDLGDDKAQATASLKQFTMRATTLDLELMLTRDARLGGYYELSVNQQFIDYVTDEQGREMTRTYLTSGDDGERLEWLRAKLTEVTLEITAVTDSWVTEAQGQNWQNNLHSSDFKELTSEKQKLESQIKSLERFAKRQTKVILYKPQIQLAAIDGGTPTLTRIVQHGLLRYIEEDDSRARKQFKFGQGGERRVLVAFIQRMGHLMQFRPAHLGPNRTYQARLVGTRTSEGEIAHIAEEYVRYNVAQSNRATSFLAKWLQWFEIGTGVTIEALEGTDYRISVTRQERDTSLADLGFGAGQLLCILLMIATNIQRCDKESTERLLSYQHNIILLIEEPEANLHPQLQSLLAELFAEVAQQYGLQLLVETHSEYLIRKFQLLVATQLYLGDDLSVYYMETDLHRQISILPDGRLSEAFGSGFFDEAGGETLALMRIQRSGQKTQQ